MKNVQFVGSTLKTMRTDTIQKPHTQNSKNLVKMLNGKKNKKYYKKQILTLKKKNAKIPNN